MIRHDLFLAFYISEEDAPCCTVSPQNPVIRFFRAIERITRYAFCNFTFAIRDVRPESVNYGLTGKEQIIGPTKSIFPARPWNSSKYFGARVPLRVLRHKSARATRRGHASSRDHAVNHVFSLQERVCTTRESGSFHKHSKAKVDVLFRSSSREKGRTGILALENIRVVRSPLEVVNAGNKGRRISGPEKYRSRLSMTTTSISHEIMEALKIFDDRARAFRESRRSLTSSSIFTVTFIFHYVSTAYISRPRCRNVSYYLKILLFKCNKNWIRT